MPPQLVFDISGLDLSKVVYDQEAIRERNPQRGTEQDLRLESLSTAGQDHPLGIETERKHWPYAAGVRSPNRAIGVLECLVGPLQEEEISAEPRLEHRLCGDGGFVGRKRVQQCQRPLTLLTRCVTVSLDRDQN